MSAGLIEVTGNLVVHHPVRVRTSSNEFTIDEPLRQPGSAPTAAELDAMDMVSIEQEVTQ
jgi:hypothetical protein